VSGDQFDFIMLSDIVEQAIINLNRVIDVSFYPTDKTKRSNLSHRPVGLGVCGLADVFFMLKLPFDSDEARLLNKQIFETMYRAAILTSIDLAKEFGTYDSFMGSPASRGEFQFDLGYDNVDFFYNDWDEIKEEVKRYGLRNSLLIALMPTASSSNIVGVNECFEPVTSLIYSRRVLSGEFTIINRYLVNELCELNLWSEQLAKKIIALDGSIQMIDGIPDDIKHRYRNIWEMSQRAIIDMAADRQPFVCQTQSMNLFIKNPTVPKLTAMHLYSYEKKLKTMSYYIRSRAKIEAAKFTVEEPCESCTA
jgi:ribonucleoside-diphosphate reductase alpha chain